jgi:exonuclease SbcC
MMNHYPRIFGLSTLGIKQHFNCDYRFHPLRTDFSGESGSGKSMVADMIQLLLVGSDEFKSGTDGNQIRDTKGMVLENKGSQYGRGYILLNIELTPRKFITLGGYLETASNQLQSFIIQDGYDWEETLKPMDNPVCYRDLLCDGEIETVLELQKKYTNGYLKVLTLKKYHQLVYEAEILSIDLRNKENLKSYAIILRAFSRGRGFKIGSEHLKTFLFGEDDRVALMDKYKEEVRGISADFQQHQRYQDEINLIHRKQKSIEEVAVQFQVYLQLRKDLVTNKTIFWHAEHLRLEVARSGLKEDFIKCSVSRNMVCRRLLKTERDDLYRLHQELCSNQRQLQQALRDKQDADLTLVIVRERLKMPAQKKALIDETDLWLAGRGNDLQQVQEWYGSERQKALDRETRNRFIAYLEEHQLRAEFEASSWYTDPNSAARHDVTALTELNLAIRQKEIFTVFADLGNPSSLAAWAIRELDFPLSLEQESLLVHFQHLSRTEPETRDGQRYLPFPERLLKAPLIPKCYAHGFWVELTGVYEFIDHVDERYLDVVSTEALARQLHDNQQNALAELQALKVKLKQTELLGERLIAFSGLAKAIVLYRNTTLSSKSLDPVAEITETDFARRLDIYGDKAAIREDYEEKQHAMDTVYRLSLTADTACEQCKKNIVRINGDLEDRYGDIDPEASITEREAKLNTLEKDLDAFLGLYEKAATYPAKLEKGLFGVAPNLTRLITLKSEIETNYIQAENTLLANTRQFEQCDLKLEEAQTDYIRLFGQLYEATEPVMNCLHDNPEEGNNSLKERCELAHTKFTTLYDNVGEAIEDQTVLADYSVGVLAHKLLPTVFPTSEVDEQLIGQQIAQRLQQLTNDMKKIGSRKLEILNQVFSDVHRIYNGYLSKVHNIHNYLKNKDHTITGGNHASLLANKSVDYPDYWMITFRKRISEQLNNQGLFEKLYQEMDINQLMIDVYRECGGTSKVTYEDLLNPKSYFDLKFEIKLESGQSNAGSNGQTYTANALLCLARLSLIQDEKRRGLKFMPIDEAEGLGGNYEMLHELAQKEKFQLITMSIETAGDILDGQQYIYIMHDNQTADEQSYVPPLGIFSDGKLTDDLKTILNEEL